MASTLPPPPYNTTLHPPSPNPTPTPQIITPEDYASKLLSFPTVATSKDLAREKILLYGEPFSGKTTLAALLSEFFYLLWFDGDNGLSAVKHNIHPEMQKRIVPIVIPASSGAPIFLHTMLKIITGHQVKICLEHGAASCPYCTKPDSKVIPVELKKLPKNWIAVMDNGTSFTQCSIFHAIFKANPGKKEIPEDYKLEFDDWGRVKNHMDIFGTYVKDGDYDFVMISHQTVAKVEDINQDNKLAGKTRIFPLIGSDKTAPNFAKNFGHEVYAKVHNNKHTYFSSSTASIEFQSGSRSNVKLETTKVPSLLHFFKPQEAEKMLEGSWTEWFFSDRKKPQPTPKGVLPL